MEKSLTKKDLIFGEIYYYSYENYYYIELYKDNNGKYPTIYIEKSSGSGGLVFYNSRGWRSYFDGHPGLYLRKATEDEKQWLLECIKQNKFIPKNQNINCEIY